MQDHAVPRAFHLAYEGTPSWETGRPQPVVRRLIDEGAFGRRVLDAGCGTGGHAVILAAAGHEVTGIDVVPAAIDAARGRAIQGGGAARLLVADVFDLPALEDLPGRPFDTVLDIGLFHVLQPAAWRDYAAALSAVARPGAAGLVVAWSDRNAFGRGPGRIRRADLRQAFQASTGWQVIGIEDAMLETRLEPGEVHAWLARLRRVPVD